MKKMLYFSLQSLLSTLYARHYTKNNSNYKKGSNYKLDKR